MNAMTGLLIFICFVLKPKVLKLMKRRYVLNLFFFQKIYCKKKKNNFKISFYFIILYLQTIQNLLKLKPKLFHILYVIYKK